MQRKPILAALCLAAVLAAHPAVALDLDSFEARVTTKTLDNGLTLLIFERPTAPVVSFFTHVDVGSAQEVPGITGLAHMFEHMAFKGTSKIGTTDFSHEKKAIAREDAAYAAWTAARRRAGQLDPGELERLGREFDEARDAAQAFVERDEFTGIVDGAGGVGLNARTGADTTYYVLSLPANKIELWAYLESERFRDPVFREFYQERDVVQEERRMRTESRPAGRLFEQFLAAAFQAHPYGHPTTGHMSDLREITREDARAFYEKYYSPSNLTVSVVGDVRAERVLPMLARYFGRLAPRPDPPPLRTVEPEQIAEKTVKLVDASQPIYVEGYHRPAADHADDAVYDAIADILGSGRTSRLHRRLVRDEKIAAVATALRSYPGTKYPHLMVFYAAPAPGHTNEEVQRAIRSEIARLGTLPVGEEELRRVKTRAKADLIRALRSNEGAARLLGTYQARLGDWRELFRAFERIENVTRDDVLRVARSMFVPTNRTVAMIVNEGDDAE